MRWRDRIRRFTARVIRCVTAVLLPVGLFLAYFLAMPVTRLLVLFGAGGLSGGRARDPRATCWQDPRGFSTDRDDLLEPS